LASYRFKVVTMATPPVEILPGISLLGRTWSSLVKHHFRKRLTGAAKPCQQQVALNSFRW
jgi:hypothetical protein